MLVLSGAAGGALTALSAIGGGAVAVLLAACATHLRIALQSDAAELPTLLGDCSHRAAKLACVSCIQLCWACRSVRCCKGDDTLERGLGPVV